MKLKSNQPKATAEQVVKVNRPGYQGGQLV